MRWGRLDKFQEDLTGNAEEANSAVQRMSTAVTVAAIAVTVAAVLLALYVLRQKGLTGAH